MDSLRAVFFLKSCLRLLRLGRAAFKARFIPVVSVVVRMHASHPGGDPFSHPSGSSVPRPVRVTDRSARRGLSSTPGARPPPGLPGARKHSVPDRVHSVVMTWGSRRLPASRPTCRRLLAGSNHPKQFRLSPPPRAGGGGRPAAPIQFCWLTRPDPLAGSRWVSPKSVFFPGPKTRVAS